MGTEKLFMQIAKDLKDANFASGDLHEETERGLRENRLQLLVTLATIWKMAARMEELGLVDDAAIQRLGMVGDKLEEFKTQNRGVWADVVSAATGIWMKLVNLLTHHRHPIRTFGEDGTGTDHFGERSDEYQRRHKWRCHQNRQCNQRPEKRQGQFDRQCGEGGLKAFLLASRACPRGFWWGLSRLTGTLADSFDELMELGALC